MDIRVFKAAIRRLFSPRPGHHVERVEGGLLAVDKFGQVIVDYREVGYYASLRGQLRRGELRQILNSRGDIVFVDRDEKVAINFTAAGGWRGLRRVFFRTQMHRDQRGHIVDTVALTGEIEHDFSQPIGRDITAG